MLELNEFMEWTLRQDKSNTEDFKSYDTFQDAQINHNLCICAHLHVNKLPLWFVDLKSLSISLTSHVSLCSGWSRGSAGHLAAATVLDTQLEERQRETPGYLAQCRLPMMSNKALREVKARQAVPAHTINTYRIHTTSHNFPNHVIQPHYKICTCGVCFSVSVLY